MKTSFTCMIKTNHDQNFAIFSSPKSQHFSLRPMLIQFDSFAKTRQAIPTNISMVSPGILKLAYMYIILKRPVSFHICFDCAK